MVTGGVGVGENDVMVISQGLVEVHKKLDSLSDSLSDLRVLIAGEYVRKDDFQKCQECAEARIVKLHTKIDGQFTKILAYATFIGLVIQIVAGMMK